MIEDTPPVGRSQNALHNAGDVEQVKVATLHQQRREEQLARDLATVLSLPEGRRFIARVIAMTGVQAKSFPDAILVQRSEGAREVGIDLITMLTNHSLQTYPQLLMEAAAQSEQYRKEREAALAERAVNGDYSSDDDTINP